jgi:hypothetical protein
MLPDQVTGLIFQVGDQIVSAASLGSLVEKLCTGIAFSDLYQS